MEPADPGEKPHRRRRGWRHTGMPGARRPISKKMLAAAEEALQRDRLLEIDQFPDRFEPPPLLEVEVSGAGLRATELTIRQLTGWHLRETIKPADRLQKIADGILATEDGKLRTGLKAGDVSLAERLYSSAAKLRERTIVAVEKRARSMPRERPLDANMPKDAAGKPDPKMLSPAERAALGLEDPSATSP